MILYHWTPNKNLKEFTKPHIYAWEHLWQALAWQELSGGGGKIIRFEVKSARKYLNYYLALTKNLIK